VRILLQAALFVLLLSIGSQAYAAECDCSTHIGSCSASGKFSGEHLLFSANTNKCAQITYSVDGQPGSITVTDGVGMMDYFKTNKSSQHQLSVDSCSVCRGGDTNSNGPPNSATRVGIWKNGIRLHKNADFDYHEICGLCLRAWNYRISVPLWRHETFGLCWQQTNQTCNMRCAREADRIGEGVPYTSRCMVGCFEHGEPNICEYREWEEGDED
jgi:hypothetical protein